MATTRPTNDSGPDDTRDVVRFVLRIPPEMHRELQQWAKDDHRSLHNLIMHTIACAAAERRQPQAA